MKNNVFKNVFTVVFIFILGIFLVACGSKTSSLESNLLSEIKVLQDALDEYYMYEWQNEKFLSIYSYFSKGSGDLVTIQDVEDYTGISISDELEDVSIHFVKPISLKEFLPDGILDEELEIMTIYTAIYLEDGVFISSKFDEGGILSFEEYQNFVLSHNFEHGEVINPNEGDEEYFSIVNAVCLSDESVLDGNVKYISYNEKYAVLVISTNTNPSFTKEFVLLKSDDTWEVALSGLENKSDSKITVNYAYTDFDLGMLPIYEISFFETITNTEEYLNLALENGFFKNEELVYSSGAGNFIYLQSDKGTKVIMHIDEDFNLTIYEVENYKDGISLMLSLEENPPVFILNFENL